MGKNECKVHLYIKWRHKTFKNTQLINPDVLFVGKWGLYNRKADFTAKLWTKGHIFTGIWLHICIKSHYNVNNKIVQLPENVNVNLFAYWQCYAFRTLRFLFSVERNRHLFKRWCFLLIFCIYVILSSCHAYAISLWLLLDVFFGTNALQCRYVILYPFQALSHRPFWVVYWCWTLRTGPHGLWGAANQSFTLHCKRAASKWIHLFIQLALGCKMKRNVHK